MALNPQDTEATLMEARPGLGKEPGGVLNVGGKVRCHPVELDAGGVGYRVEVRAPIHSFEWDVLEPWEGIVLETPFMLRSFVSDCERVLGD